MALGINDTYYHLGSQATSGRVSTCTGDHHESFLNFIFYTLLNVTYLSNSLQLTECSSTERWQDSEHFCSGRGRIQSKGRPRPCCEGPSAGRGLPGVPRAHSKNAIFPICAYFVAPELIWEVKQHRAWLVLAWVTNTDFCLFHVLHH